MEYTSSLRAGIPFRLGCPVGLECALSRAYSRLYLSYCSGVMPKIMGIWLFFGYYPVKIRYYKSAQDYPVRTF